MKEIFKHRVYLKESIADTKAFILTIDANIEFKAGQVLAVSVDKVIPPRLYSIASGIHEDRIKILFDVVPEGILSSKLSKLNANDDIYISKPFGDFICDEQAAYWIAAGTGIAPFASMFYSGLSDNKVLLHGGRTLSSFYFQDDFKSMRNRYIKCCTQEKGNDVYEGRLTHYLKMQKDLPLDYKYYLCGSAEMINDTRNILLLKGIPFGNIMAEIYF